MAGRIIIARVAGEGESVREIEQFNSYMNEIAPPILREHNSSELFSYRYAFALGCKEVSKRLQQHVVCIPRKSSIRTEVRCLCYRWMCKWYQEYEEPPDIKQFPIGWCKRFEPDPASGYVMAHQLPPCVVCAVEREP